MHAWRQLKEFNHSENDYAKIEELLQVCSNIFCLAFCKKEDKMQTSFSGSGNNGVSEQERKKGKIKGSIGSKQEAFSAINSSSGRPFQSIEFSNLSF